jgi:hypothetical protein
MSPLEVQGFAANTDYTKLDVIRYMPLIRFLGVLELEAIWFSRLGALQDKFECTNPRGPRAFVLKLEADAALDKNGPASNAIEQAKAMGIWEAMQATSDNGNSGDAGRQMGLVNCWFIGELQTERMWNEYGDSGMGVAIRSTVDRLTNSFLIPGSFRKLSRVGCAKYVDFRTYKSERDDMTETAFLKDKTAYSHENEVRIVTMNSYHSGVLLPDGSPTSKDSGYFSPTVKGVHIKCNLKTLIKSVIVGPHSDSSLRMLIKRIVARYGLVVDVESPKLAIQ